MRAACIAVLPVEQCAEIALACLPPSAALGKTIPKFGAGLLAQEDDLDSRYDYKNLIQPDTQATSQQWQSVTTAVHAHPSQAAAGSAVPEFGSTYARASHTLVSDKASLEAYRKRWIRESDGDREARFTTSQVAAVNPSVPKQFRRRCTRVLPGVPKAVELFREKIIARGGANGIRSMGRMLRILDDNGDGRLQREELEIGLRDFGLDFTADEFTELFRYLDRDGSGTVDSTEFFAGIKGEMNQRRQDVVWLAFSSLDEDGSGVVTVEDMKAKWDGVSHPDVESGRSTLDEVWKQFLGQWERASRDQDGQVTWDEFLAYYSDLSAAIDHDDAFELMVRNAWHLAGGEGAAANTSNIRVLVTHSDGTKSVQAVKEDLFLSRDDTKGIISRLKRQGVDVVAVDVHF